MHRWDRHLQDGRSGQRPVQWSEAATAAEQLQLRSHLYRRSSHGWYVAAHIDQTPAQRIVQTHAILKPHEAIGGWAAAHWLGSPFMDGIGPDGTLLPVPVCIGTESSRRRQRGIEIWRDRLLAGDVETIRGVRCTSALRTAFDLARRATSDFDAVAALDTLIECGLLRPPHYQAYLDARRGWRGVPRARRASQLATAGVRSPSESRLRMIWQVSAGLPAPLVNVPVFSTEGYLVGIPDLLSPEASLAVEYDGEDHLDPERRQADTRRDARFAIHGLSTLRVSQADTAHGIADLVSKLTRAYHAGRQRETSADRWTLVPPPGWVPPE